MLTTSASTGRRTNRSVNLMSASALLGLSHGLGRRGGVQRHRVLLAQLDRRAVVQAQLADVTTRSPACKPSLTTTRPCMRSAVLT